MDGIDLHEVDALNTRAAPLTPPAMLLKLSTIAILANTTAELDAGNFAVALVPMEDAADHRTTHPDHCPIGLTCYNETTAAPRTPG